MKVKRITESKVSYEPIDRLVCGCEGTIFELYHKDNLYFLYCPKCQKRHTLTLNIGAE